MKKYIFIFLLLPLLIFISCFDPIFYNISNEDEILDPKISGNPGNFVMFNGNMYVASGMTLYRYNGHYKEGNGTVHSDKGDWDDSTPDGKLKPPGGRIFMLAATNSNIFALCEDLVDRNGEKVPEIFLRKSSNPESDNFSDVPVNIGSIRYRILSVYSINNRLFLGAWSANDTGGILIKDASGNDVSGSLNILTAGDSGNDLARLAGTDNKLLNGAEYNNADYYLSAIDLRNDAGCIYVSDLTPANTKPKSGSEGIPFTGIINLKDSNNTIVAINRKGVLYYVSSLTDTKRNFSDHLATGALAIYEKNGKRLLLAGRQNNIVTSVTSGYMYGYLELEIGNGISGSEFREPGKNSNSSMPLDNSPGENGKYNSSIGKMSINHIFQYPGTEDNDKILFVSTQKNGIWSYRYRKSSDSTWYWYWNAEQ